MESHRRDPVVGGAVVDTQVTFAFELFDLAIDAGIWRGALSFRVVPKPDTLAERLTEQLAREARFFLPAIEPYGTV